jgi:outer membrane protein
VYSIEWIVPVFRKVRTRWLAAACACWASAGQALDLDPAEYPGSLYPSREMQPEEPAPDEQDDGAESVWDAIAAALANNPDVQIARSQFAASKADRFAALGQFLPDIEVTAAYADENLRSATLQTLQDRDGATLGVTAVQPISQGLSAFNRFRSAQARQSQSELAFQSVRLQTALEAAQAHAAVILAREVVDHRVSNLALVSRQFEIVSKRERAGAQGRTGVEQARVRRAQANVDLAAARATLAESEAAYQRVTGRAAPPVFAADDDDLPSATERLEESIEVARRQNPSLNAAEASVQAAKFSKHAAVGDFAPRVTLEGSYFRRFGADQTITQQDEEYQLVARMRMPIFNQGRNIAALRTARASIREAHAQYERTRLSVDETVTRSWRQLTEAVTRRVSAREGIDAAKQSVRGLQMEYEAGQRTVIDVLDGQRDLVQAEISLSQAEFDLRVSRYELAAATGAILDAVDALDR